jgi:Domain of unknown function (DUF4386)
MAGTRFARWSPVSGVLFVALWVIGLSLTGGPDSSATDAKILAHYADSGNRRNDFVAFFLVLAASLVSVWFLSVLRERLAKAEGGPGRMTAAAFGAGLVSTALWMIGIAFFVAPSGAVSDTSKFTLDPNTYRILNDLGYGIWFSGTTIAAVTVVMTALLSLRAGFLPRWMAWLSFVVAATMLVAFFFIPFIIFLGWVLVVSAIFLWRELRPADAVAVA